jgi:hypothetical protein
MVPRPPALISMRNSGGSSRRRRADIDAPSSSTAGAHHNHQRRNKPVVAAAAAASGGAAGDANNDPQKTSPRDKLAAYGVAGVVAYGILNTLYYTFAFAFAWFYLQPNGAPATGQGWAAAAKAAGVVMAGTWVGSQVTKVARAAGAVALAPVVDGLLERVAARLGGDKAKGRAVAFVVSACLLVWAAVFLAVLASVA